MLPATRLRGVRVSQVPCPDGWLGIDGNVRFLVGVLDSHDAKERREQLPMRQRCLSLG